MNQRVCDRCGKIAPPGMGAGWFHGVATAHYILGGEPRELDFCGWACMAAYADEQNTSGQSPTEGATV